MDPWNWQSRPVNSESSLPKYVLEASLLWRQGYDNLHERHEAGVSGKRIATAFSDLLDQAILIVYRACVEQFDDSEAVESKVTLVLHGGCGRREFCPHSDVDLMLL